MAEEEMLAVALELLGLGMFSVFIILSLLIMGITLLAKVLPADSDIPDTTPSAAAGIDGSVIAAIQSAIHLYRKDQLQKQS